MDNELVQLRKKYATKNFNDTLIEEFVSCYYEVLLEIEMVIGEDIKGILNILRSRRDVIGHARFDRESDQLRMTPYSHKRFVELCRFLKIEMRDGDGETITRTLDEECYKSLQTANRRLDEKIFFTIAESIGLNYLMIR